jgi:hypothetical protein
VAGFSFIVRFNIIVIFSCEFHFNPLCYGFDVAAVSKFQPVTLTLNVNAEIAALKIAGAAKDYGVEIEEIVPELVYEIMELGDAAKDTRELARVVDAKLGDVLLQARSDGVERATISIDDSGQPVLLSVEG